LLLLATRLPRESGQSAQLMRQIQRLSQRLWANEHYALSFAASDPPLAMPFVFTRARHCDRRIQEFTSTSAVP
jgi:hypothetical protein